MLIKKRALQLLFCNLADNHILIMFSRPRILLLIYFAACFAVLNAQPYAGEKLTRALIALPSDGKIYLSWRFLITDDSLTSFDIYRSANGSKAKK